MSALKTKRSWDALLDSDAMRTLEREDLPAFLGRQRWFAGKARSIRSVRVVDSTVAGSMPEAYRLAMIEVAYEAGGPEVYFLPLGLSTGPDESPLRTIGRAEGFGTVHDALSDPAVGSLLLEAIGGSKAIAAGFGTIRGQATGAFDAARGPKDKPIPPKVGSFEQSNSAIIYGDRMILKVFRRLEPGINPDFEIGKFLSERTKFDRIPRCAGALLYERDGHEPMMLGILQGLVANQGTGWDHALESLSIYYANMSQDGDVADEGRPLLELAGVEVPESARIAIGPYLQAAATLGRRTGELHLAMASDPADPAFRPEPISTADLAGITRDIRAQVDKALKALGTNLDKLPEETSSQARTVLDRSAELFKAIDVLAGVQLDVTKIRCHGDYHLGQVLRSGDDFVLLDFEGEPAKSLVHRRAKQPALKDVVGMIRSFDYAAFAALFAFAGEDRALFEKLVPAARSWRTWTSATFLEEYLATTAGASFIPEDRGHVGLMLDALTLDKALYELLYELNNRPAWVRIPLQGVAALIPPEPAVTRLTDLDIYLLAEGTDDRSYDKLGAHPVEVDGVLGVHFAVWAPNARSVSVIGDFNDWDAKALPMTSRRASGYWERFVPGIKSGDRYKYEIVSRVGDYRVAKADPYAFATEPRPATASIVADLDAYTWGDAKWVAQRKAANSPSAPISIYELHLGSWMRGDGGRWLTYAELMPKLVDYVQRLGYTHVEFMPVAEHPFDGSWGYQVTGYFAPTSRFGTPLDFMALVDGLHQAGIGAIVDWVPAHFPTDEHALGYFDGTHLYEHADPKQGFHQDWNTFIFDFGRPEVMNFLVANALFWLDKYHVDGLRVDAVASMLYRDYSRKPGEWVPNVNGGRENYEAIALLRRFNERVHALFPDALTIAEESTSWPMVTRPTSVGGLGFDLKWDLGWMHDTLDYMSKDPVYRKYHHNQLTFRGLYAYTENFVLPLSHDEVVYGKGSLLTKMPGDAWRKFAGLRLLLGYQFMQPGKKLMFMGDEFGQGREWNHDAELDWQLLDQPLHAGLSRWVRDLNTLYRGTPELHELDNHPDGFAWVDADDAEQSVLGFLRKGQGGAMTLVVANFTPIPRQNYRVGVPLAGHWVEVLNGDATLYGGSGQGNQGGVSTTPVRAHGQPNSVILTLPPLALIALRSPAR